MKKFLKLLIVSVLSALCLFGLFACDSQGDKEDATTEAYKMYLSQETENPYYVVKEYICDGKTKVVEIPKEWKGYPVKEIKANAFKGNEVITEIIVPSSVETINEGAFAGVKKLEKLTVPFIGKTANSDAYFNETKDAEDKAVGVQRTFAYFFGTESYNYGVSVTAKYGSGDSDSKTYYMPVSLKEVVVQPTTEYSIPMYAFAGNTVLNKVVLVGNFVKIGDHAFDGCEMLTNITIPASVTYIGKYAFNNAKSLADAGFSFADGTESLTIGDYAFYGVKLENLVVPTRTTSIGEFAFASSTIKNVTISTKKIANYAFKDCTNLDTVVIGDATTEVGVYAFSGCSSLSLFGKAGVTGTNKIDLTGINVLGAMSFASLNQNATYSVVSTLGADVLGYAFFKTTRA